MKRMVSEWKKRAKGFIDNNLNIHHVRSHVGQSPELAEEYYQKKFDDAKMAFAFLLKNGWIRVDNTADGTTYYEISGDLNEDVKTAMYQTIINAQLTMDSDITVDFSDKTGDVVSTYKGSVKEFIQKYL